MTHSQHKILQFACGFLASAIFILLPLHQLRVCVLIQNIIFGRVVVILVMMQINGKIISPSDRNDKYLLPENDFYTAA